MCYHKCMDVDKIIAVGLNKHQATAYALLIERGKVSPSESAECMGVTRTNAYKILDSLVEIGLASKDSKTNKVSYSPTNPMSISNLVVKQRNIAAAREEAAQVLINDLLAKYHVHTEAPYVKVSTGKNEVVDAYKNQISQQQPIYFLRSKADIPTLGFDSMHDIRITASINNVNRYGICPDDATGTVTTEGDKASNLTRTWMRQEDYTAPVEWSVSGSSVIIVVFGESPHAITIENPIIAEAFRQIWHILNNCLQAMPYYKDLPR